MKDEAIALARNAGSPFAKLNLLREYLQAFAMRSFHESEAFLRIAFVGGTALRFLYNLPRFSEDLDFSLVAHEGYAPEKWYDLLWYRSQRPPIEPNLTLLQNALDQTDRLGAYVAEQWKSYVNARLKKLNAKQIQEDVAPFLERTGDATLLTPANLKALLR